MHTTAEILADAFERIRGEVADVLDGADDAILEGTAVRRSTSAWSGLSSRADVEFSN